MNQLLVDNMGLKKFAFSFAFLLIFQYTGSGNNDFEWWQNTVIYQVYPRSFKDSNADGIGDLRGIEEQAKYFNDTGITTIWLSPIYKSPMTDMGYDVSDYVDVDPIFGTLEHFDSLVKTLKSLNLKIILDFIPNHSSDEHEWFKKSVKKIDPYTNYYVWRDPKSWNGTVPIPPNNWICFAQESAWEYVSERKQFYYHAFDKKQPDLNYHSKELVEEMKNVLRFWLDRKVDGFRADAVGFLVEDSLARDEPAARNHTIDGTINMNHFPHIYTKDLPETYEILHEFRQVLETYKWKDGHTRLLLTEAYTSMNNTMAYYGNSTYPVAHVPFNFGLIEHFNSTSTAHDLQTEIRTFLDNVPEGKVSNWVMGNHDQKRIASRLDPSIVDGVNMLLMLLPGITISYNGDELGMTDTQLHWDQVRDVFALSFSPEVGLKTTRDVARTPFQWNTSIHSGFSKISGKTWLPVNPNYWRVNLETQKNMKRSHYNVYKKLVQLKSNPVIKNGDLNIHVVSDWVISFKRSIPNEELFLVIINLGNEEEFINLNVSVPDLPRTLSVHVASINSEFSEGDKLSTTDADKLSTTDAGFKMRPKSSLVLHAGLQKPVPPSTIKAGSNTMYPSSAAVLILFISVFFIHNQFY